MERTPIPISLKRKIKFNQRPEIPEDRLQIAHIESVFRGGTNDESNLTALTLIEHAFQHFQDACYSREWEMSRKDWYAVRTIVAKMSPSERKIFSYLTSHING